MREAEIQRRIRDFRRTWDRLSEQGFCDAAGGAEWFRVWLEWEAAGYPAEYAPFIREAANRPAPLKEGA